MYPKNHGMTQLNAAMQKWRGMIMLDIDELAKRTIAEQHERIETLERQLAAERFKQTDPRLKLHYLQRTLMQCKDKIAISVDYGKRSDVLGIDDVVHCVNDGGLIIKCSEQE
jgi:hypothetical protein